MPRTPSFNLAPELSSRPPLRVWLLALCLLCGCRTSFLPPNHLVETGARRDPGDQGPYAVSVFDGQRARVAGQSIRFDLYVPGQAPPAPIVVVSHGFGNASADMSDWGLQLASWGFVTAIPSWPHTAGLYAEANADSVVALLDWLASEGQRQGGPLFGKLDAARRAVVGHSFGGQVVLLAAERDPRIGVVVALDPVDGPFVKVALRGAGRMRGLSVVLRADPSICNLNGSDQAALFDALSGKKLLVQVAHASHCDPEQPGSWPCNLVCGVASPARARLFRRYTTAALLWGLYQDLAFRPFLDGTTLSTDQGISGFESHLESSPPKD